MLRTLWPRSVRINELIVCRRKEPQLEAFEIYPQYCRGGLLMIPRAWENGWKKRYQPMWPSDKITITCHGLPVVGPGTQSLDSRARKVRKVVKVLEIIYLSMIDLIWAEQREAGGHIRRLRLSPIEASEIGQFSASQIIITA
jgi:hypothetical protein